MGRGKNRGGCTTEYYEDIANDDLKRTHESGSEGRQKSVERGRNGSSSDKEQDYYSDDYADKDTRSSDEREDGESDV